MAKKKQNLIWMSFLGQSVYENLNPFWWFCERMNTVPNQIILFHSMEDITGINRVEQTLSIVSKKFNPRRDVNMISISFNDENAQDFYEKAEEIIIKARSEKNDLFIDISPTTWSFVPVYMVELYQKYYYYNNNNGVAYIQYTDHSYRQSPYPLIPHKGIIIHDFSLLQSPAVPASGTNPLTIS